VKTIRTELLEIAYDEGGPKNVLWYFCFTDGRMHRAGGAQ
jgi:hypothetical protein